MSPAEAADPARPGWVDLAGRAFGGSVIAANDETFGEKENLLTAAAPTFTPRTMGARGQVYDGWETRRRRTPGADWVIVRLGVPGLVHRVVVDTAFFRGNFPATCEVAACWLDRRPGVQQVVDHPDWTALTGRHPLAGDTANAIDVAAPVLATHLRLSIHPDGGVARLRVLGEVLPDPRGWRDLSVDLAAAENGGVVLDCSDRFFSPPENVIAPGRAATMGDGWETRRRREPGSDWLVVGLAAAGRVRRAVVDTTHFVGNAPAAVRLSGRCPDGEWRDLLPTIELLPDTRHRFGADVGLAEDLTVDQVRVELIPDGGLARLELWGDPDADAVRAAGLRWWNELPAEAAARQIRACCSAPGWASALVQGRPHVDPAALLGASEAAVLGLDDGELHAALAGHPRIGERTGQADPRARREQAGVGEDPVLLAALAAGNVEYETRFGHVYLVRAHGRSGTELLRLLHDRLSNDAGTERDVVRRELAEITALRLHGLWS